MADADITLSALGTSTEPRLGIQANSLWDLAVQRARATPEDVFAVDEHDRRLTFEELLLKAERAAAGLHELGISRGSIVSWQLPTWLETAVLTLALSRIGAVQNPLIMMLRDKEVRFICGQLRSQVIIVPVEYRGFGHLDMARSLATDHGSVAVLVVDRDLPDGDPATLPPPAPEPEIRWAFYTSGTTSDPKGAQHTDQGLLTASDAYCNAIRPVPTDRLAALAPIAHIGGIVHLLQALQVGCSLIFADIFDPQTTTRALTSAGVTHGGTGAPFARMLIAQQKADPNRRLFSEMKAFMMGGAPRVASLHREVKEGLGGVGTVSGYGLTECPYISWASPTDDDDHLALSDGHASPGVQIRIVGADGRLASVGEPGELRVRAPQLMRGYVDPALDAAAFDELGFFCSGDVATIDVDGYVTITGRLKDVIIRNMENISAREVEEHLVRCEGVAEAAVVGRADPITGERVVAVVVPADPANPPSLESLTPQLLAQGLNKRKLPETVELINALPRNAMGKILKRNLRPGASS